MKNCSHNFRIFQNTGFQIIGKINAVSNYSVRSPPEAYMRHGIIGALKYKKEEKRYNEILVPQLFS